MTIYVRGVDMEEPDMQFMQFQVGDILEITEDTIWKGTQFVYRRFIKFQERRHPAGEILQGDYALNYHWDHPDLKPGEMYWSVGYNLCLAEVCPRCESHGTLPNDYLCRGCRYGF